MEGAGPSTVVFDPTLTDYDFGPQHPMSPIRVDLTMRLAQELGVTGERLRVVPAPMADLDQIATVHDAALIEDLIQRGLYEQTMVVAMGEFGRTPRMNDSGGRDHWGHAFSALVGCGSMKMGQAIGKSDARGEFVRDRPISPQDVAATVYHHLGIEPHLSFNDAQGRGLHLVENGRAIGELIG